MSEAAAPRNVLPKEKLEGHYLRRIRPGIAAHGRGRPPWRRQPTVLFIVGQPGAGKTTMQAAAMDRLGMKNAYVVDHDELLEKHPGYASGVLEDDYSASGVYGTDAGTWRAWALQEVQNRRMDVVVPYPIGGQGDVDLMRQFQERGYRVEVAFAAVHEAQSQLGIMERFNDGRQEVGYGRWIGSDNHDMFYQNMLGAADAIETQGAADAVHVYRRGEAEPVFTNERKNGVWRHQPGSTRWAIQNERNRPWTDREVNHFVRGYNKLAALARRPVKDHFKAMPLMASAEGQRLLGRLRELAGPKLAEHQRLTAMRAAAERAQTTQQQPQHPQPQVPARPLQAPHGQHVAQPWQQQAPAHPVGQQPQQPQPQQSAEAPTQPLPRPVQQVPARPQQAPHGQHVAQPWQQQAPAQPVGQQPQQPQSQVGAQRAGQQGQQGHDWQSFAVRLQSEQSPAAGISAPEAEAHSPQDGGQRPQQAQGTARNDRSGGDNSRLAR
ncbi:zeta toxin family protein [Kribbella sp. NPDC004875]|uniref:zeta toxin family protein n=1 Tax=Kribbella sp. NPDC004875 TaxID=3364107 RepID=UPI00368A9C4C